MRLYNNINPIFSLDFKEYTDGNSKSYHGAEAIPSKANSMLRVHLPWAEVWLARLHLQTGPGDAKDIFLHPLEPQAEQSFSTGVGPGDATTFPLLSRTGRPISRAVFWHQFRAEGVISFIQT